MIRQLPSGEFRLYSRKKNPATGKRRNLGTFKTRATAERRQAHRAILQAAWVANQDGTGVSSMRGRRRSSV